MWNPAETPALIKLMTAQDIEPSVSQSSAGVCVCACVYLSEKGLMV